MNMTSFSQQRRQWVYRLFGPTTLHLQHEFYLWVSLSVLTLSSLQSLYYRQDLHRNDGILIMCVSLWLSRHLLMRWLCTQDTSSSRNPTMLGVVMHWITSYVTAGQYMDRTDPAVVAKLAGTLPDDLPLLPSLSYTLHYLRVMLWYPILRVMELLAPDEEVPERTRTVSSSNRRDRSSRHNSSWRGRIYVKWMNWLSDHGPSIQMCLTTLVATVMIWDLVAGSYPAARLTGSVGSSSLGDDQPRGVYQKHEAPKWADLFLLLSRTPTLLCIFWYGRIALPIPDLVAGSNVLKSVRAEALLHGSGGTSTSKSSKVKQQHLKEDVAWAERYKSIAVENRYRLACKVAGIRIADGFLACVIMPRTLLACRLTGHCPDRPALWELSSILNPVGLTGPLPTHISKLFRSFVPDRGSLVVLIISVILITSLLLLAQIVTLNGSYLAIMGYVSGEWVLVEDPPQDFEAPANWDPRRRYKKGDLIVHPGFGGGVYRAASNNPEGRPFDLCLRATHDLFRNEMGHSSTSQVIAYAIKVHMAFISLILCMLIGYKLIGYATGTLLTALLANLIACYGLATVGLTNHKELASVAREIMPREQSS